MFHKILCSMMFLMCVFGFAYGDNEAIREVTKFDIRDFYIYDEANLIQRLILAPKIVVNFLKQLPDENQIAFLNKFSLARRQKDTTQSHRYILEFASQVSEQTLVETLTDINNSLIAEGIPVVLIDNVEAIAEGFIVETYTPLVSEMIGKRLKRFGEFSIRQTAPEGRGWLFIIDEVKSPLHLYPLINLIKSDAWVKSVRPKFRYLHQAIVSTLEIVPISGTVDETRTVRLFIRVFDPEIKIRIDLLPNFGEGKFIPNPVPPPLFFFPSVGARESSQEFADARGKVLSFQWRFRLFAPGEWTILPQTIAYERQGEQFTVSFPQVPFVVTSLIGNLAINDMPSPKLLPLPDNISNAPAQETAPVFPSRWFDTFITQVLPIAKASHLLAIIAVVMGIGFPVFWGVNWLGKKMKRELEIETLIRTWRDVCYRACQDASRESYQKLETTLMRVLYLAFSDKLPHHPILKDVEEQTRDAFDDNQWKALCMLYEELGNVHARNFIPDKDILKGAAEQLLGLIDYLIPIIDFRKESAWKSSRLSRTDE